MTTAQIEAAAKALHSRISPNRNWDDAIPATQEWYRDGVRAVLDEMGPMDGGEAERWRQDLASACDVGRRLERRAVAAEKERDEQKARADTLANRVSALNTEADEARQRELEACRRADRAERVAVNELHLADRVDKLECAAKSALAWFSEYRWSTPSRDAVESLLRAALEEAPPTQSGPIQLGADDPRARVIALESELEREEQIRQALTAAFAQERDRAVAAYDRIAELEKAARAVVEDSDCVSLAKDAPHNREANRDFRESLNALRAALDATRPKQESRPPPEQSPWEGPIGALRLVGSAGPDDIAQLRKDLTALAELAGKDLCALSIATRNADDALASELAQLWRAVTTLAGFFATGNWASSKASDMLAAIIQRCQAGKGGRVTDKGAAVDYGMRLATRVFQDRGGARVEIHIDRSELAALLALAFGEGRGQELLSHRQIDALQGFADGWSKRSQWPGALSATVCADELQNWLDAEVERAGKGGA